MTSPPVPADEAGRLTALREADILDTPSEVDFDELAALAAEICETPIGLVSLVDADRQWFKAKVGIDVQQVTRDLSFCAHAVATGQLLEVPDATLDDRFASNPAVTQHGIRFYAAAPLILDGRHAVGTVCVIDRTPRVLTPKQRRALRSLARHAALHLELRRYARHAADVAERLRQLDRLKDSFLASTSHELRTPLTSIRGYLEALLDAGEDGLPPATVHRFLSVMQRNSDRLLSLVDDLLFVARSEDGVLHLHPAVVDLADLAHHVVLTSRPLAEHKNITIDDQSTTPVLVLGDGKQLTQALNHVIYNAIKFTPATGTVTVLTDATEGPRATIRDTGAGIQPADLPHLFDPFYRTADADDTATQGAGLGLRIVKAIIEAHGGDIHITSEPGAGTTVTINLPPTADVPPRSDVWAQ
jgi:signal transduction histidine kinase